MLFVLKTKSREQIIRESERDMRLLDNVLGPLARRVVNDSPRILDVAALVQRFRLDNNDEDSEGCVRQLDLRSEEGDAKFAEYVKSKIRELTGKPFEEHIIERREREG